ncbi:hypothetical protein C357_01194 [Citreicella sp. 357]|nr:hypothetical protein C357_01194 [Citreicella sp. 357]
MSAMGMWISPVWRSRSVAAMRSAKAATPRSFAAIRASGAGS